MHVAFIADFGASGGTRTYFFMLAELLRRNFDVSVLASVPKEDHAFFSFVEDREIHWEYLPPRHSVFTRSGFSQLWELSRLHSFIRRRLPDMFVVSTGTPGFWLTTFLMPVPSLQILHTAVHPMGKWQRLVLPPLLSRIAPDRQLVTVSQYAADQIARHWGQTVPFIHNATPFPEMVGKQKVLYGKHVITAGHIVGYKNPDIWLEVARRVLERHPDARFSWYGEGELLSAMRDESESIPRVHFHGKMLDMKSVYAAGDIYFQPSRLESHGMAVLEAMSFGLPCVVSKAGGLPESVLHEVTGYVEELEDAQAFAARICSLLDNAALAEQLGRNGQSHVQAHFLQEHWEEQTLEAIRMCLCGKQWRLNTGLP